MGRSPLLFSLNSTHLDQMPQHFAETLIPLATRREAPRSTEGERRDDSRAC
jgi:hypothetical protein